MSDTQGSHRRVSWPEAEPDAAGRDSGGDPGRGQGAGPGPDPGVPAPRAEGRRAARRRAARAERTEAAPGGGPGGTGQGTGRRRAGAAPAPAPAPGPAEAPAPVPARRAGGGGRRRAAAQAEPPPPAAAPPATAPPPAGTPPTAPADGRGPTGRRRATPRPDTAPAGPGPARPTATGRRRASDTPPGAPSAAQAAPDRTPGAGRRRAPAAPPATGPDPAAATGRRRAPAAPPATGAEPHTAAAAAAAATGRRRRTRTAGQGATVRESWRRIVPQALVVAFLAGGTTAFVAADKSVHLTVDGEPRTLHTFAGNVEDLLDAEGLGVGPHDLVAPARDSSLEDGEEVVVRYGRPLRLTLDGTSRQMWTTARTVDAALRQLGVRVEGAYLSAPRTAPVPRAGLALSVRTERGVTFMADGRERTIRTNAATVQEALDQAGITLRGEDTTSVPPDSFPRDGQTITVLRITGTREVREERIPYATERVDDDTLFAGTEVVERAGRPGARRVTYGLRTVNGVRQPARKIAEEVVREPVSQLVKVGTKPLPTSVAGADHLDWGALAQCESGGRPSATDASGTYGGLYQFDVTTWQALGGSGRPQDAPAGEQTFRAKKLYVQRGASPWPHCGRRLYR
ncbi:ubiquitin-like domain-containing protein [Streptomyces sp. NPDC029721]|uniref:ubiquitin-like domain-containing protein n=1 Tax=Streptomyces sp. NPDC029721 TaxID=3157090 RepID=UPI0033C588CD